MLQYIENLAILLGTENCKHCGKIDISFGLIKDKNRDGSKCFHCENHVREYSEEKSLLFALKLFRQLAITNNEVKASSGKIISETIDNLLNPLFVTNKIPTKEKLITFQGFFKKQDEIIFGGPKIGGFVKIENGISNPTIIENTTEDKIFALFILSIIINYLLTFKNTETKPTPASLAVMLGTLMSELFIEKEHLNALNTFEVLLFSSIPILHEMKRKKPNYYLQFEKEYFNQIEVFANKNGITEFLNGNLTNFIDKRFQLYGNELNGILNDALILPTKTAYNFFISPLQNGSSDCLDIGKLTDLKLKIVETFNSDIFGKSIDQIIFDLKL